MHIHSFLIFVLVSLFACQTDEDFLYGKVVQVADGDTLTLLVDGHQQVKVRLYGIDCPEPKQDFSTVAKNFTRNKVFHQQISVEVMDIDPYGRTVGIVHLSNGEVLNEELLKAGLAWHYTHYDKSIHFATLEREAREKKIGVWSVKSPLEPWNFRRQQRRK